MDHSYANLTYLDQQAFPSAKYSKAAALRKPLCDAINSARHSPSYKMDEVTAILEAALKHIRSQPKATKPVKATKADPLDDLLGAIDE